VDNWWFGDGWRVGGVDCLMNKNRLATLLADGAKVVVIVVGYVLAVLGTAWGMQWLLRL